MDCPLRWRSPNQTHRASMVHSQAHNWPKRCVCSWRNLSNFKCSTGFSLVTFSFVATMRWPQGESASFVQAPAALRDAPDAPSTEAFAAMVEGHDVEES